MPLRFCLCFGIVATPATNYIQDPLPDWLQAPPPLHNRPIAHDHTHVAHEPTAHSTNPSLPFSQIEFKHIPSTMRSLWGKLLSPLPHGHPPALHSPPPSPTSAPPRLCTPPNLTNRLDASRVSATR